MNAYTNFAYALIGWNTSAIIFHEQLKADLIYVGLSTLMALIVIIINLKGEKK